MAGQENFSDAQPVRVIRPRMGLVRLELGLIWKYRQLLYFLAWRDIKVRYKQTILGVAWAIIQPFFTMVVFSIFFGRLANIPSDGLPYPIFSFTALVPWTFFASALTASSNSLVGSSNLVTKVYFPRLIIPISSIFPGLVDFLIAFAVLGVMMLFYGITPTIYVIWLPLFVLLATLMALGAGLWLSALNVKYRDVRYAVPFMTQLWLFATPIAYPSSLLEDPWRTLYGLNPMVSVVEGFRRALLNSTGPSLTTLATSGLIAMLIFISGIYYFRSMEKDFADII